jgi:membrane-associated protease RseP (regulator of RpoE activity)
LRKRLLVHGGLFVLTVASTFYVYARQGDFVGGLTYSSALMVILLSHEMGHYLMSRRYAVPATLPYFIPFPYFSPFGTLGAVIRMSGVIRDKKALFDIGVAGPLCGFVLSVPCLIVGIKLSRAVKIPSSFSSPLFGDSILSGVLQRLLIGPLPKGYDLLIHPLGFAGWVGLFVTALNLLPIGQLDGGHIVYAALGKKSVYFSKVLVVALAVLSIFFNVGWLTLVVLLLIFGIKHPDPMDPWTPLDRKRRVLSVIMLFVFVLSFVPAPMEGMSLIQVIRSLAGVR